PRSSYQVRSTAWGVFEHTAAAKASSSTPSVREFNNEESATICCGSARRCRRLPAKAERRAHHDIADVCRTVRVVDVDVIFRAWAKGEVDVHVHARRAARYFDGRKLVEASDGRRR